MSTLIPNRTLPILSWWTLLFGSLLFMFPFFWTLSTALKTPTEISRATVVSSKAILKRLNEIHETVRAPNFQFSAANPETLVFEKRLKPDLGRIPPPAQEKVAAYTQELERLRSASAAGPYPTLSANFTAARDALHHDINSLGLLPQSPEWGNFKEAWTIQPFTRYIINTLLITVLAVACGLLSSSLVGYGFARFDFWGREVLFMILLGTMMLPSQVTMIPNFITWTKLGLVDTFFPMILPSCFGVPFMIFFMRQYFMSLPKELVEAAEMDGASPWQTFWLVMMPNARPALITLGLLSFFGHWDDFFGPLLYLNTQEHYTVSIGLRLFQDQYSGTMMHLLMAAALIHLLPCVLLFLFCQRYFVRSMVMSGIKG